MAVVHVTFEARMQAYERSLREAGNKTDKEIRKMVADYRRLGKAAQKDSAEAAKSAARAARRVGDATKENIGGLRKVFEGLQGSIGSTGSRILAMGEAAAIFGPAGAAGIALAAGALLVAGVGIAAVKSAQAISSMVDESADLVVELSELNDIMDGGLFSEETSENILAAAQAMDAAEVSGSLLKIQLSDSLAPAVEDISGLVAALGLAWRDVVKEVTDVEPQTKKALLSLRSSFHDLLDVAGHGPGLLGTLGSLRTINRAYAGEVHDLTEGLALQEQMTAALAQADTALAEAQKASTRGQRAGAKAAREAARALREQEKAERDLAKAALDAEERMLQELESASDQADADAAFLHKKRMDEIAEQQEAAAEQSRKALENIAREKAARAAAATASVEIASQAASDIRTIMGKQAEQSKKLAIFEIGVSTAAAVMKAIEQYGLPWGLIPAGLSVAAGAAQIAAVNKEQFHTGGILGSNSPPNVDEQFRTLRNEVPVGVMTAQGLNAANGGRDGGGQSITIVQQLDHKTYNAQTAQNLKTNSPLARAIKTQRRGPVGHRSRR